MNITRTEFGSSPPGTYFAQHGLSRSGGRHTPHDMVATVLTGCRSMLSAIISTQNSERGLVPTLSALVPAAAAGLLAEVVVADGGSRDATAEVADIAGCRFTSSTEAVGIRLKAAAASVRSPWIMFLRAGAVPQPGWIDAAEHFIQTAGLPEGDGQAGMFRLARPGQRRTPRLCGACGVDARCDCQGPKARTGPAHSLVGFTMQSAAIRQRMMPKPPFYVSLGRRRLAVLPVAITCQLLDFVN